MKSKKNTHTQGIQRTRLLTLIGISNGVHLSAKAASAATFAPNAYLRSLQKKEELKKAKTA